MQNTWERREAGERAEEIGPAQVFREYEEGVRFKNSLGARGLYEQNRINERFLAGDQWHGANCGDERPLVRHNVIKRIADYKLAVVGAPPLAVNYSADGVPNTVELRRRTEGLRDRLVEEGEMPALTDGEEISLVMGAMSDYFRVTAERVGLEELKELVLRGAYTGGSSVLYTYWDDRIRTGLYADLSHTAPIRGDIACEVLDIENVYFGDPTVDDVQEQPYILIAQRQSVGSLRREARRRRGRGLKREDEEAIRPDRDVSFMAGGCDEPMEAAKATVITRFWKDWSRDGGSYRIMAMKTCRETVIRPAWDTGLRLYPLAKFSWERRRGCAYGDSEITYLIPNQIAINRMLTASVWAVMVMGMPIMVVNGDIVTGSITNDPGQILKVFGSGEEVGKAVQYVTPPSFSPQFEGNIEGLISNTLTQAGANSALLGDVQPNNTSAIIAVREAATMPLNMIQNRFYGFCEEVARIWAEFWVTQYGSRSLKIEDERGVWYLPFDGDRYRDLLISVRVDAGASTLWSESQSVQTLDHLFDRQVIDVVQYLSRLPKGTVPNLNGLIRELQHKRPDTGETEQE